MYRAVTLYFLRQNIDIENNSAVEKALKEIDIDLRVMNGQTYTFLNGENVCLLYTSPSPRDRTRSRMPSSA